MKYDTDLGQLQADFNEAQSSYIAEKARMREIEDHFDRYRWEEFGRTLLQCEKDADAVCFEPRCCCRRCVRSVSLLHRRRLMPLYGELATQHR